MVELTPESALQWLTSVGIPCAGAHVEELGGGVSNKVLRARLPDRSVILKQAFGQLRVEQEWLSDRTRIFREAAAMKWLAGKWLAGKLCGQSRGHVPRLLAEDRENFAIAMEAAPDAAEMWKTRLFAGAFDTEAAHSAGALLRSIISVSRNNAEAERIFGDQTVFDQLRIDPYYRFTARRHPEVAPYFHSLIARSAARRLSLVHGDWSPKNLLIADTEAWAIDWEVVHYGDPSYDVAFLLNHLLLKSVAMPRHREALMSLAETFVRAVGDFLAPALEHLPALLLARVDGKSPAEYLDAPMRAKAWKLGLDLMTKPARSVAEVFAR